MLIFQLESEFCSQHHDFRVHNNWTGDRLTFADLVDNRFQMVPTIVNTQILNQIVSYDTVIALLQLINRPNSSFVIFEQPLQSLHHRKLYPYYLMFNLWGNKKDICLPCKIRPHLSKRLLGHKMKTCFPHFTPFFKQEKCQPIVLFPNLEGVAPYFSS